MHRVEQKLAEWYQLVQDLEDAQSRLKATPAGPARKSLKAEVRRLTAETGVALDAVSAAIAAEHMSTSDLEDRGNQAPFGGVGYSSSNWPQRRKGPLH